MTGDTPRYYVGGVVIVPARTAHILERLIDLHALRVRTRGKDAEFDQVLQSLRLASLAWAETVSPGRNDSPQPREDPTPAREIAGSSRGLSTASVAARLGVTPRRVQQLAAAGDLPAERVGRLWSINPNTVEDYRKRA